MNSSALLTRTTAQLRRQRFAVPLLLGIAVLLGYGATLRVFFLSDDFVLLTTAQLTDSLASVFAVDPNWFFYRPLGKLLWVAEYRLFGTHAVLYRLVSLSLHWLNSLLVVALVRRLAPATPAVSLVAGALWALLPLNIEAVVWLASQYDLLATLFYLLTLVCLVRAWQRGGWGWYLLCGAATNLACGARKRRLRCR